MPSGATRHPGGQGTNAQALGAGSSTHPAPAVLHGRLAAGAADAGASAAAWRGQEVAGLGAVLEPAAAIGRKARGRGEQWK